jgi:hypothetical protein
VALGPVVAGTRCFLTTRDGRVLAIDATSGEITATAQLPQGALQPPAISQARVFQLGEQSTLFVLDGKSLACQETVFVGHKAGSVFVPPVAVHELVIIAESPADDFSVLRLFAPDPKTKRLAAVGRPLRLKGRITTPLAVSGLRIAAITDLAEAAVYEVDTASKQEPLRLLGSLEASESSPALTYCELDKNRLFVASRRQAQFEVQASMKQLSRRWTENRDDPVIGPPRLVSDIIVQVRRRAGVPGVSLEGLRSASGGEAVWTIHLAAPLIALGANESQPEINVVNAAGAVHSLGSQAFTEGRVETPSFAPPAGSFATDWLGATDGAELIWTEQAGKRAYRWQPGNRGEPQAMTLSARAAAPLRPMGSRLLAALDDGSVSLIGGSDPKPAPFMPPLVPGALPLWTFPGVSKDGQTALISDGRTTVYALSPRDKPQAHLASIGESRPAGPVVSPLVAAGANFFGIMRTDAGDSLAGFNGRAAAAFEPVELPGRLQTGPFVVGQLVLVAVEPAALVCFDSSGKKQWQQPLVHGPLAGPVLATKQADLLILSLSGIVSRISATTGEELSRREIGEPLEGPGRIVSEQLLASGADGVLHRIDIPPRP